MIIMRFFFFLLSSFSGYINQLLVSKLTEKEGNGNRKDIFVNFHSHDVVFCHYEKYFFSYFLWFCCLSVLLILMVISGKCRELGDGGTFFFIFLAS